MSVPRSGSAIVQRRAASSVHQGLTTLIGRTPLVELTNIVRNRSLDVRILAKVEFFNPAGSVKDRAALGIITAAERAGKLKPGDKLVDITSGNTGIGLAAVAAARGYRTKFYLRSTIGKDKINLLKLYGAEVVLIDNKEFLVENAIEAILERIVRENPDAYFTDQRANPANPEAHYATTGPEIWQDSGGEVDILVSAVGTGGSVSGTGRYLKEKNPRLRVVISEPADESLPSPERPYAPGIEGVHKVTNVDPSHLPANFHANVIDEALAVTTETALDTARAIAREEGILAGMSSGASLHVALTLAKRPENAGKTIVAIFPDSGERYLSYVGDE